jgi:hypothetical protein
MKFSFVKEQEEKPITLPTEYIDMVKTVIKFFPVEYDSGTHFVKVAIYRLYLEKKKEWQKEQDVKKEEVKIVSEQNNNSLPMFQTPGMGNAPVARGWEQ